MTSVGASEVIFGVADLLLFSQGQTAIVDQDNSLCFVMDINTTLVRPISDFYNLVKHNKVRMPWILLKLLVSDMKSVTYLGDLPSCMHANNLQWQ